MLILWNLVFISIGLVGAAFFSGAETGLISLNRLRLRHEVERRHRRAIILNSFLENTERLLGTTLIGTNLAEVVVSVYMSALFLHLVPAAYGAQVMASLLASALIVTLGGIVPKTMFRHYAYRLCMTCADLLNAAAWLLAPFVSILGVLMRLITRAGGSPEPPKSFFVTREELKHLAKESEAGGALTAEEREMIDGVFDLPSKTVYEAMIPLSHTVTVSRQTSVKELFEISQRTGFARFPVLEAEKIVGIANVYEILFENTMREGKSVGDLMRRPQFVLSTERVNRVLPVLRAGRQPISIVLDPEGRHLGILTIEDIVEEIVGDVEG